MESDNRAELREADRLAAKARAATQPLAASVVLLVAEMILVGVIAFAGVSTRMAVVWLLFLGAFHVTVRSVRRAQPRRPWANPESRRLTMWAVVATVVVNAVWIPLFFFARPVALTLLFLGLLASLVANVVMRRPAHA